MFVLLFVNEGFDGESWSHDTISFIALIWLIV